MAAPIGQYYVSALCGTMIMVDLMPHSITVACDEERTAPKKTSTLLSHYSAGSGILLPAFRDELSLPSFRVKQSKNWTACLFKDWVSNISNKLQVLLTPWSRVLLEKLTGFAAKQEIPRILWNPKVHHRTHKRPPQLPV